MESIDSIRRGGRIGSRDGENGGQWLAGPTVAIHYCEGWPGWRAAAPVGRDGVQSLETDLV